MFTFLGRLTTRHPWRVLIAWFVVLAAAVAAFLFGFGNGGLFERLHTSEYKISGTQSAKVMELTTSSTETGPVAVLIVGGVDTESPEVQAFASDHRDLLEGTHVESVTDAFSVRQLREEAEASVQEQIDQEIADQVAEAMGPIETQANDEANQARAQIQSQVDQAAALGPEAQAAAQVQADAAIQAVDQQTAEAIDQARAQVTQQVTEAVKQAAADAANTPDAIEQREEAERAEASMLGESGDAYAVIVTRKVPADNDAEKAARADLDQGIQEYQEALQQALPGATVKEMSSDSINGAISHQIESDLIKGEALGLPVAAILMLVVFGGALAAGLPLVGAVSAIVAGMGILWASTWVTDIDSFVLNVVSIIGLSLSIDYGLLVVSRFREEGSTFLAGIQGTRAAQTPAGIRQKAVIPAVQKTVQSAGRTVVFSAITIALSLSGIFFIRVQMLRIIAWGGIIVTVLAVLAAVTIIPALLTLMGGRLLKPSPLTRIPGLGRLMAAVGDASSDHGIFSRIAHAVQRRPWTVMIASTLILVVMALPIRGLELRNNFTDYLPEGSDAQIAFQTIQDDFPELASPAVEAVIDAPQEAAATQEFVAQVEGLPHVTSVATAQLESSEQMTLVTVRSDAEDEAGPEVTALVQQMRDLDPGADVWVGGSAANQFDFKHAVASDMPAALLAVGIAVMILLFLMTASIVVPIKALIINSLSIIASLGATTAVFQNGWLGVPQTPGLETFIVVCMIAFGFGLSMDYEVFLLARIKEFWDAGETNNQAVASGLQRSGRIITSAAAIVIAVFIGFALGDMVAIKQIGVGLAIMVATDATITRMLLVPATMTIMGKWNWWAPKPLAKLASRVSLQH